MSIILDIMLVKMFQDFLYQIFANLIKVACKCSNTFNWHI